MNPWLFNFSLGGFRELEGRKQKKRVEDGGGGGQGEAELGAKRFIPGRQL